MSRETLPVALTVDRTHDPDTLMTDAPPLSIRLLISWLTNALVLGVVAAVLSDVHVNNAGSLLLAAAVFGVLNTLFKPVLRLITLPVALFTFGLAWFFVSMLMLVLTRDIVSGFFIHGFWTLVWATVIVWVVNLALDFVPGPWQIAGKRGRINRTHGRGLRAG
jgi:putative membrane protein